jgi:PAS domain S-box-containing protein
VSRLRETRGELVYMRIRSLIRERFRIGLGPRVVGLVLLAVVVTGTLTGGLVIQNNRSTIRDGVLARNLSTATLAGELAAELIRAAEGSLLQLSVGPVFSTAVLDRDLDTAEFHLARGAKTFETFDSIAVFTPDGIGWASSLGSAWQTRGESAAERDWFRIVSTTKKPYLGLPFLSPATGRAGAPYAIPILDAQGGLSAILVGAISLAQMSDTIAHVDTSEPSHASLIDTREGGIIVADTDPTLILRPASSHDAALAPALTGQRGTVEAPNAAGEMELVAFAPLTSVPWSVVLREPTSVAFAPVRATTSRALIIVGAILLAALIASVFLARRITVPLRSLVRGAEEVGGGNLDYRLGTVAKNEIGVVSRAFDLMTAELQTTLVSRDELASEVAERKRAEEALEALARRQRAILHAVPDILTEVDADNVYVWANDTALEFFGDDVVGKKAAYYFEGEENPYEAVGGLVDGSHDLICVESWQRRKDGKPRLLAWMRRSLSDDAGNITGALSSALDITDRRRAEEALRVSEESLRQSQKMEAVGQLAGGMAHDFNNLLTAILGYSDLILAGDDCEHGAARADVLEIKRAAERAGALTRQILAFSRRQALKPTVVCLNDVIRDLEPLLRRTLGEVVDLTTVLYPALNMVEVDVNQFEQVAMNLALNARDAMPSGGVLTIETANVAIDEKYSRAHPDVRPGQYVLIAVTDTGVGMDDEVKRRVFEPFFTTKPPGEGTGLGLSTVYGIVKQSSGSLVVCSEPGRGTTFKVYLPVSSQPVSVDPAAPSTADPSSGKETILVVEDEASLRSLVARVLGGLGYSVLMAGTAAEAFAIVREAEQPIDMLLTDVVLPGGVQGNELARDLLESRPELPVLYMSGYTRDAIVHAGRLDEGVNYLAKPFTPASLAEKVREVLKTKRR